MDKEKLNKKIDLVVNATSIENNSEKEELKSAIKELINRVEFSENYCDKCDARLFFKKGELVCPDCNIKKKIERENFTFGKESEEFQKGIIPPKALTSPPPKAVKRQGPSIQELRNKLDSPQPQGDIQIPGAANPNDINWS